LNSVNTERIEFQIYLNRAMQEYLLFHFIQNVKNRVDSLKVPPTVISCTPFAAWGRASTNCLLPRLL